MASGIAAAAKELLAGSGAALGGAKHHWRTADGTLDHRRVTSNGRLRRHLAPSGNLNVCNLARALLRALPGAFAFRQLPILLHVICRALLMPRQEPLRLLAHDRHGSFLVPGALLAVNRAHGVNQLVRANQALLDLALGKAVVEHRLGVGQHHQRAVNVVKIAVYQQVHQSPARVAAHGVDEVEVAAVLRDGRVDALFLAVGEGADEVAAVVGLDVSAEVLALKHKAAARREGKKVDLRGKAGVLEEEVLQNDHIHVRVLELVHDPVLAHNPGPQVADVGL